MNIQSGRQFIFTLIGSIAFSFAFVSTAFAYSVPAGWPLSQGYQHLTVTTRFGEDEIIMYNADHLLWRNGSVIYTSDGSDFFSTQTGFTRNNEFNNSAILASDKNVIDWNDGTTVLFTADQPNNWVTPPPPEPVNYLENIGLFLSTMSPLLLTILGGFVGVLAFSRFFRFIKRQLANPPADIQRARSVAGHTKAILRRMDRGGSFDR